MNLDRYQNQDLDSMGGVGSSHPTSKAKANT